MHAKRGLAILAAVWLAAAPWIAAQTPPSRSLAEHARKVRSAYMLRRDAVLETRLALSKSEAGALRGLKNKFDREMDRLEESGIALLVEFDELRDRLDPVTAAEIAERFFSLERARLAVEEEYFGRIAERVSPVVAVQFIQIHRRFDLEVRRQTYARLAE